jgi:DNA-binding GntR family transcriptional regulator
MCQACRPRKADPKKDQIVFEALEVAHSTTVDRVADELRRAIFAGDLPPETPLREVALAEATSVARSTVREALGLLVADGLAVRVANKGVQVKQLHAADIRDVIVARRALESAGVCAYPTATPAARQSLDDAFARYAEIATTSTDPSAVSEAHLAIHRALVGLTGSERLLASMDALAAEIRLGLAHVDRVRGNLAEQVEIHRILVDKGRKGPRRVALAELERHLDHAEASLVATVECGPSGERGTIGS